MTQVIAVCDIGKTNKKLLLFDQNFRVVYQFEQKFAVRSDDDGFECDDIDLITTWINESLADIVRKQVYELVAVNFSTYGASLMFLDENGERLTPVYNYLKPVDASISEKLFSDYGGKDEFSRKTASPALGLLLNSGIQILWLKHEKPELFGRVNSILHFPQYLSYRLSGEVVSEPTSIGCHTFLWDFDNMIYHKWITDHGIRLPEPQTNDVVFPARIAGKEISVGTGIHDSSASLVPYLKGSPEKFILISTGTWCINMNPFNTEPLTASQLEQDCLCFLSPDKAQVKSSRLFMGHFHEVWSKKLAVHFNVPEDRFKQVQTDESMLSAILQDANASPVFFPNGKESFDTGLQMADLSGFENYEEAYTKLMIELTALCVHSIKLVIPENDDTKIVYISGGFARNPIFIYLLQLAFPEKKVLISEVDNSSALGAALVISGTFGQTNLSKIDLGLSN